MEIGYGPFERLVHVPENVDPDKSERFYTDGFLVVKLPLKASEPKNIDIK